MAVANTLVYCQLVLSLTLELDGTGEKDKATLDALLTSLITGLLQLSARDVNLAQMSTRCPQHEVKLVVLRLLSVLMSRRQPSKSATEVWLVKPYLSHSIYYLFATDFPFMSSWPYLRCNVGL